MSTSNLQKTAFHKNLEMAAYAVADKPKRDFWLNRDGTVTAKTQWFSRIVRWFQNLFCNKTFSDIWHVFNQTIGDFYSSSKLLSTLDARNIQELAQAKALLSGNLNRLSFAVEFLMSRKSRLEASSKRMPCIDQQLRSCISELGRQKKLLFTVFEGRDTEVYEYVVQGIKNACYPPLSRSGMSKKPPRVEFALTKEGNRALYESVDIGKLDELFLQLPLSEKESRALSVLVKEASASASTSTVADLISFVNLIGKKSLNAEREEAKLLQPVCTKYRSLVAALEKIKTKDETVFGINAAMKDAYYEYMEVLLKNLVVQLENNKKVSAEKMRRVLEELSIAAGLCPARQLEESKKQYRDVVLADVSVVEANLLEFVQGVKEDLFLGMFGSSVEFHILNTFRSVYGKQLGLDDSHVKFDIFSQRNNNFMLEKLLEIFLEVLTSAKLILGVMERINLSMSESFEPEYFSFLAKCVKRKTPSIEDPIEVVQKDFMSEDQRFINEEGVFFLLSEIGMFD